jgi:hemerythrin-like metal-binding protein
MLLPIWSPVFCVGNEVIDEQHKMLLSIGRQIERLAESPENDVVRAIFCGSLKDAFDFAVCNFETEEALLAANGYPEVEAHARQHSELFQKLNDILYRENPKKLDRKHMARVLAEHIVAEHLESDLECKRYLAASDRPIPAMAAVA